jgi:hypothetical protein
MAACLALAVVDFIRSLAPDWNGAYIAFFCGLAAWEAGYSHRLLNRGHRFLSDRVRFRAIELALFFITLRVAGWLNQPDPMEAIRPWLANPLAVLDLEIMLAFGLVLTTWYAATDTLSDLEQIEDPTGIPAQDAPIPNNLTTRFFIGGIAALIFSGLARVGRAALLSFEFSVTYGVVLNVLVYFAVGLILIGQMQLARLQTLWRMQGIPVAAELPARWARYTLTFLALAGVLAFILPTRYTAGLLGLLGDALFVAFTLLFMLSYLILLPVALLINFLMSLLGLAPSRALPATPRPLLPPPSQQSFADALAPWLDYLRSIVVWVIVVGMMAYVLINYFRERPELLRALAALRPVRALRRWWAALRGRVGGWMAEVNARLPRDLLQRLLRRAPATPFNFFRLGAASPREQITYYYLSLLRRAREQGFARRPSQTPGEFQPRLNAELPEAQPDTEHMTREFIEARYSPHPLDSEHARRVRAAWERVRAALRERQRRARDS